MQFGRRDEAHEKDPPKLLTPLPDSFIKGGGVNN